MLFKKNLPPNIIFLKNSQALQQLLGFSIFIHCTWGGLGVILLLWFKQADSLQNFAYYYSTLTFVAGTSFLWTNVINKIEIRKLSLALSFLYLIRGLLLFFPHHIFISILSGTCGGICIIFYTLISRTWIDNWNDEREKSYVIGWSNSEYRFTTTFSTAFTGIALSLLGTNLLSFSSMILFFSITPFISYFFIRRSELKTIKKPIVPILSKIYHCFQLHKKLLTWTLCCNLFLGLHIGLIISYTPILLNKIGFTTATALNLISIGSFVKIFCQPLLSALYRPEQKGVQILIAGISYALLLGIWGVNLFSYYLIPIVIVTFVAQTAFSFYENNICYTIFPKEWSLQLFTLGSFIFHLSNIGGSFLGNLIISHDKIHTLIFIGSFTIGLSGLLYYLLLKSLKHNPTLA